LSRPEFQVRGRMVGYDHPSYFIADIAANHDGDLQRAIELVHLAAEAGADAVKFQHFRAEHIVSDYGFKSLGGQQSHQEKWKQTVYEVYEGASVSWDWTEKLIAAAKEAGVHFFSSPYDFEAVHMLDQFDVPAFKLGSGDVTWIEIAKEMARTGKPLLVATGASEMSDVERIMDALDEFSAPLCLMQCNTNYTGSLENMRYINLNVLKTYAEKYPDVVLGLSDHTPGHATVLGAVTLGARAIEKHFTDDVEREGPDHGFSMSPKSWREMVDRTRELEAALGSTEKFVAKNEKETVTLQRRCLRVCDELPLGHVLAEQDLEALRPAPLDGIFPYDLNKVIGKKLSCSVPKGDYLKMSDIDGS